MILREDFRAMYCAITSAGIIPRPPGSLRFLTFFDGISNNLDWKLAAANSQEAYINSMFGVGRIYRVIFCSSLYFNFFKGYRHGDQ